MSAQPYKPIDSAALGLRPLAAPRVVTAREALSHLPAVHLSDAVCEVARALLHGSGSELEAAIHKEVAEIMPETSEVERRKLIRSLFIVARAQLDA